MKINIQFFKTVDWLLYILPVILVILGISIIYSLTYFSDIKLFYNQIFFFGIGLILMVFFTCLDYRQLKSASVVIYLVGIALLVLVLILGKKSFGATSWFSFGFFDFQPSELFKIILIIMLARFLSDKMGHLTIKTIFISIALTIIPIILIMFQPDFGTAVIFIAICFSLLVACKLNFKQIFVFIMMIVIIIPIGWFLLKDYQQNRLLTFLNPSGDPYGSGYNITQSLIAVGNGGIFGKGFGHGAQSQLNFLPVAHTDFVFAGIAEAIGFVGSVVLIIIISVLIIKILNISKISKDNFGSLLAVGFVTIIFVQSIINIGMNIGLMPVTGITLPFISYGGSSLVPMLISIGILQSIYLRRKKITFR